MASEMVLRVARVLWGNRQPVAFDDLHDSLKVQIIDHARAAIKAMREPTDDMVEKAFDGSTFQCAGDDEITEGWRVMIDQALKGTPE